MGGEAKSRMDRIIRLHEEIDSIKADIREIYAEEKADGGDKTAMGAAISIIRKREKDRTAFDDREAMVDVYLNAYASPSHTHAREASQSYAEAKGVLIVSAEETARDTMARFPNIMNALHASETSEITDTQEQPETASQSEAPTSRPEAVANSAAHLDTPATEKGFEPGLAGPACDHDDDAANTKPAPIPPSAVTPPAADKTGAAPLPSSAAPVAPFDNPRCLNDCHLAHSKEACHDCLIAWSARPKDEQVRLWAEANAARAA